MVRTDNMRAISVNHGGSKKKFIMMGSCEYLLKAVKAERSKSEEC